MGIKELANVPSQYSSALLAGGNWGNAEKPQSHQINWRSGLAD